MIIIKYNVHVTMLFDGLVRRKSDNLICFMVGIVIEYYCRVDHNIFVLLCNNVGTLVDIRCTVVNVDRYHYLKIIVGNSFIYLIYGIYV